MKKHPSPLVNPANHCGSGIGTPGTLIYVISVKIPLTGLEKQNQKHRETNKGKQVKFISS